jgi:hypothetical protein
VDIMTNGITTKLFDTHFKSNEVSEMKSVGFSNF